MGMGMLMGSIETIGGDWVPFVLGTSWRSSLSHSLLRIEDRD